MTLFPNLTTGNLGKCDYLAKSNDRLIAHMRTCSIDGEIHKCIECGYKSGTKYGLSIHMKKDHLDSTMTPVMKCQECDFTAISR